MWRYDGLRAVVTGCAAGMGEATARLLGELGASIIGLDVRAPTAAVDHFVTTDLAEESSIEAAVAAIDAPVDALFNCAAAPLASDALTTFLVNLVGHRHLTEALLDKMVPGSAIVSVSAATTYWDQNLPVLLDFLGTRGFEESRAWFDAHRAAVEVQPYVFTKQALVAYTMYRCVDLAGRGIRINSVEPGPTEGERMDLMMQSDRSRAYFARYPKPMGRFGTNEEQARALVFLNSRAASFVTGANLWNDGGVMAGLAAGTLEPPGVP